MMTTSRILIVDDDEFMRRLLQISCRKVSTSVEVAASGHDAMRFFEQTDTHPDIVILDLKMPDIDGVQFSRMLSEMAFTGGVILVSGTEERILQTTSALLRRQHIDVLGYLNKPVSSDQLQQLLTSWQPSTQSQHAPQQQTFSAEEIQAALSEKQFFNLYQPKVRLSDGTIAGYETLARWRHPKRGVISPVEFIPQLSEPQDLQKLTVIVLEEAFAAAAKWQHLSATPSIAVNVTMEDLQLAEFPKTVLALSKRYRLSPEKITIEVTESSNIDESLRAIDAATSLRIMGFSLSIDDFGTGHSTMSQLSEMPFSELKIDRSFVTGADSDNTRRSIFNASLNLANELNMSTVAEGIESEADWQFVRQSGCDYAQGYFISRPMPANNISNWQTQWQQRAQQLISTGR